MKDITANGKVSTRLALVRRKTERLKLKQRINEIRYSGSSNRKYWTSAGRTIMKLPINIFALAPI
jgi:hypothetical protein